MRRRYRFNIFVLGGLAACVFGGSARADDARYVYPVRVASLSALPGAVNPGFEAQDVELLDALQSSDRLGAHVPPLATLAPIGAPRTTEHLDFGRIGGLALISREVDQYGRIRGVDFLTYSDPDSHWDIKLNVNHGAMFQITHRWGGGGRGPFSDRAKSRLVSDNR